MTSLGLDEENHHITDYFVSIFLVVSHILVPLWYKIFLLKGDVGICATDFHPIIVLTGTLQTCDYILEPFGRFPYNVDLV